VRTPRAQLRRSLRDKRQAVPALAAPAEQ
jgi:hypothetical protein